jgi:hypothetical protein
MNNAKKRSITAVVIFMAMMLASGSVFGAKIPTFLIKGKIESGNVEDVEKGILRSSHIWEYDGEKSSRVVIAAVIEKSAAAPEMFLFKPGTSECVARGELSADSQALVIDKKLDESGTYLILIRPKRGEKDVEYRLALKELPDDASYQVVTNADAKTVIAADKAPAEKDNKSIVMEGALLIIAPFLVLPMMVASIGLQTYSLIGSAVDVVNVPGYNLYQQIVGYGQGG